MFFALSLLGACSGSDVGLIGVGSADPAVGPVLCEFEVHDVNDNIHVMRNEYSLAVINEPEDSEPEDSVTAGPVTQLARYQVSLVHSECPGLDLEFSNVNVEGTDENHVRWWEDLNAGGLTVFSPTLGEVLETSESGEQVLSEAQRGDAFKWVETLGLDLYIPPDEPIQIVITADTSRASSGVVSDYSDLVFVRFGWSVLSDGSDEAQTITNYSSDVVTILRPAP